MSVRYDLHRDTLGWTVFDQWTGKPVVLSGALQSGMSWIEGLDLIDRLMRRGAEGHRSNLQ